jgi:hypothetical protein
VYSFGMHRVGGLNPENKKNYFLVRSCNVVVVRYIKNHFPEILIFRKSITTDHRLQVALVSILFHKFVRPPCTDCRKLRSTILGMSTMA